MTGELHHLLLNHLLIGIGLSLQEGATGAFVVGLECGLSTSTILPQLFKIHTSYMLGTFPREQVSEFLSGLLIDTEAASMRDYVTHQHAITLVAGILLTARYR